jgi:mercuric ion binding protein
MRTLLTICLLAISVAAISQQPRKVTATIKTPGAMCEDCKARIEKIAPQYVDGLILINVNFKGGTTRVQWYPDRTNIEEIKTAIANAGYDADDVTANPDSYKLLMTKCKKPEDGGTHKPKVPPPAPQGQR